MASDSEQENVGATEFIQRIRDVEEKHNILKDRVLLVGNNLIETKESANSEILEIKKELGKLKKDLDRVKDFIETLSSEMSKFAKKEDIEILQRQAKMFQPANFIRREELKEELEKIKN